MLKSFGAIMFKTVCRFSRRWQHFEVLCQRNKLKCLEMETDIMKMDVYQIKDIIKQVRIKTCEQLEAFNEGLAIITSSSPKSPLETDGEERGHLKNLYDNIQSTMEVDLGNALNELDQHSNTVKDFQGLKQRVEKEFQQLKTEHEDKSQKNIKLSQESAEILRDLQSLRDTIRTYKLLTGVNFVYNHPENHIMGYIKRSNSEDFTVFNFTPSEVSPDEITKQLWNKIHEVTEKDCD